jgi:hypothetical protein
MKYYIAVYEKLREIYLSRGAMENDLPMICPSLRMYENEDLELLKPMSLLDDQQKKIESIIRKQNISYELNSVPISPFFWDLNTNTALFDIYRDILQLSNIKNFEQNFDKVSIVTSTILNDAKNADTKEYKNYKKFKLSYDAALQKISDHLLLFDDLNSDDERNNWKDQLLSLNNQKELAMSEWKVRGSKDLIDKELLKINASSDADLFLTLSHEAKFTFDAAEKTDVISNSSIHDINFIPYDFMENESGWNSMKLEKAELEAIYLSAKNSNENLPTEVLSIDYDEGGISGIELDYTFVHLKRSWFNKNVLLSNYFQWNEPKPISDGNTISDGFKLPAIPKTMMLIKNLKIILDSSVNDSDINNPNQLIFFGPMVMKQQLFVNQSNNEKFLKVVTDKRTIQSDQLSYLSKKTSPQTINITRPILTPQIFESAKVDAVKPVISTINIKRMNMGASLNNGPVLRAMEPTPIIVPLRRSGVAIGEKIQDLSTPLKPILVVDHRIKSGIFIPINLPQPASIANITFRIKDSKNDAPIYKCSLSIIGTNSNNESNRVFNIETDQNGTITQNIPLGEYKVSLRTDEYSILDTKFSVANTNPQVLEYKLQREEIKFKSFFLIGMICEKMPKIPFTK